MRAAPFRPGTGMSLQKGPPTLQSHKGGEGDEGGEVTGPGPEVEAEQGWNPGFRTSSLCSSHCPLYSGVTAPPHNAEFSHGVSTREGPAAGARWTGCILGKLDVESGQGLHEEKGVALSSTG